MKRLPHSVKSWGSVQLVDEAYPTGGDWLSGIRRYAMPWSVYPLKD
ncbi:MAG: hypothetical protein GY952_20700 [Rhodobacteraceae bacterium]|nr:hypothetical protein [Paracoccaceae bacterium]